MPRRARLIIPAAAAEDLADEIIPAGELVRNADTGQLYLGDGQTPTSEQTAVNDNSSVNSYSLVLVDDADYTVTPTDTHILYKNLTADRTVTLPDPATSENRKLQIKHGGYGAFDILLSMMIRENPGVTTDTVGVGGWVTVIAKAGDWWIVDNR